MRLSCDYLHRMIGILRPPSIDFDAISYNRSHGETRNSTCRCSDFSICLHWSWFAGCGVARHQENSPWHACGFNWPWLDSMVIISKWSIYTSRDLCPFFVHAATSDIVSSYKSFTLHFFSLDRKICSWGVILIHFQTSWSTSGTHRSYETTEGITNYTNYYQLFDFHNFTVWVFIG